MGKSKIKMELTGVISSKYEKIKLSENIDKQRFMLTCKDGQKFFITAFGAKPIADLMKYNIGKEVTIKCGKEINQVEGKEYTNFYLDEISDVDVVCEDENLKAYLAGYLEYIKKNGIDCQLKFNDIFEVFSYFIGEKKLSDKDFNLAVNQMVSKFRNSLYFRLDSKEKFITNIDSALRELNAGI